LIVKDNKANTHPAIEKLFAPEESVPGFRYPAMDFQGAHRSYKQTRWIEICHITLSSLINNHLCWPYLEQVFKFERHFITLATGEVEKYSLTSLTDKKTNLKKFLTIVRREQGIENGLHYRRDVTIQENQTRMTNKKIGRAMAAINNLMISVLNNQGI